MESGHRLAHYTIVQPLGRGGMGEVYVAHDGKLNRQVALKLLPHDVAGSAERLDRFRREAQAVAALNHPNIVTIYSVEEDEGVHFITLELIDGQTLANQIPPGGVSIATFFKIAIPLVDAVAAAHQRGVIHRDLKPANVMITPDQRVKVLDFGLAKLFEPQKDADVTAMADQPLTGEGRILGTAAYMSPEQVEAKPLDHRTDIFSLGVVLYELATGARPFKGDTQMSIVSSVMRDVPPAVTSVNTHLPLHLGRIIRKALEKDVTRRYQTALDLRNDLDELKHEIDTGEIKVSGDTISDPEVLPSPVRVRRRSWPIPVAGLVILIALAGGLRRIGWLGPSDPPAPVVTVRQMTTTTSDYMPTVSPDGQWFAFSRDASQTAHIYLQSISDQTAVQLTKDVPWASFPAFSPDGTTIAFSSFTGSGGIYVMGRMGGNVRRLTDRGFNPSWSPDGTHLVFGVEPVFGNPYFRSGLDRKLFIVNVASGQQKETGIGDAVQPAWSPHGQRIAFWGVNTQAWRDIYTASADGGERVPVTNDAHVDYSPVWSPDGRWLYFASTRGGPMGIWRVAIDEQNGTPNGAPQQITVGGLTEPGLLSVSGDGRSLMYQETLVQTRIDAVDVDPATLRASGERRPIIQGSRRLVQLDVSPDGEWLAYRTEDARQDIYVARSDGTEQRQVTNDEAKDWVPRWSPDSKRLAFYSNASGRYQVWTVNRDGSGRMQLSNATSPTYDPVWSPDGSEIAYLESGVDSFIVKSTVPFEKQEARRVPRFTENGAPVIIRASDWNSAGTLAADGIRLYTPATGQFESLVTAGIITNPRWMRDGRLFYRSRGNWVAFDTKTRAEQRLDVPLDSSEVTELVLSADARRAYLVTQTVQSDIWRLEIK